MPEIRAPHSWRDPRWERSVARLTPAQKFAIESSLKELVDALRECDDPLRDSALNRWSPSRWAAPRKQQGFGQWVEYYLGDADNRGRVIVCAVVQQEAIYLVARTAVHDHGALRELVASFRPFSR